MTEKSRPRWLIVLSYALFFVVCFAVSIYLTFPMSALKPKVLALLQQAVANAGPAPGRYGVPSEVKVAGLDVYRLSGVALERLSIRLASTDPDPAPTWEIDRARVRLKLLPLIIGKRRVAFDIDAYEGNLSGSALIDDNRLAELEAEAEDFALGKIPALAAKLGVPWGGTVGGDADLKIGKTAKEIQGKIALTGQGAVLGPGEIKIPFMSGALTVPAIDLGKLEVVADIAEGKAKVKPAQLTGKDLQIAAEMTVTLRDPVSRSTTAGALELKPAESFLKANPKFQPIFDLTPDLKRAKGKDGGYYFKLAGILSSIRPVADPNARVN
ncbi:MAG: type II secretion system protein GspN [Deltaproteobacteria bacterium]|nr:type II secretion system protein GspN [Deltaproteobacteria bacterium]